MIRTFTTQSNIHSYSFTITICQKKCLLERLRNVLSLRKGLSQNAQTYSRLSLFATERTSLKTYIY